MAYDASNNKDDQSNVMGSTPLSQGSAPIAQDQSQGDSAPTPSAPNSGASSTGMSSQGTSTSKAAPKSSSGMFTNIQKYVQKNKPQAQKMSQAVQADTGSQAEDIRKAAQKNQEDTAAKLGLNADAIKTERSFADTTVGNIMGTNTPATTTPDQRQALEGTPQLVTGGPAIDTGMEGFDKTFSGNNGGNITPITQGSGLVAPEVPTTSEADMDRYFNISEGKVQGLHDVSATDFTSANSKAQALRALSQNAKTEQGRKNLLRGTFGDRDQGYSRGMAGLDQLILGGDDTARANLISGIEGQTEGLQGQLQAYKGLDDTGFANQRTALNNMKDYATGLASTGATGIKDTVTTLMDKEIADRKLISEGFDPTQTDTYGRMDLLKNVFGSKIKGSTLDQLLNAGSNTNVAKAWKNTLNSRGVDTSPYSNLSDFRSQVQLSPEERELIGLSEDNTFFGGTGGKGNYWDLQNKYGSEIARKLGDFSIDSDIEKQLTEQGFNREQINENRDLNLGNVATEDQISKYNALQGLLKKEDIFAPENKQDYLSADEYREMLARYNK